ncbi:MAG TPA: hypothetical protein VIP49_02830 [Candidatus Udaeobacter sp.]|jgi:hypothetical protein
MSFQVRLERSAGKLMNLSQSSGFLGETRTEVSTSLDMTKRSTAALFVGLMSICAALAQETPSTTPIPTPSPNISPTRSVRISFVPPPLEGTISLGIYDSNSKLVRVLHQEARSNEFTIGADALVTQWDGKDDDGEDLPDGKYHARGYLISHFKVQDLGKATAPPVEDKATANVKVKLMPNPLANDERPIVELGVGFDDQGSFLKTIDGLPICTISETPNLIRASIVKNGEKSVDVWQDDGTLIDRFRISNIDKMMAFDCGDFELK